MIRHLATVAAQAVRDRRRPVGDVPARVDQLDAALLSNLLGSRVESVTRTGGSEGTTDRAVLALTGDDVPASVFAKTAPAMTGARVFGALAGLGENEVAFYRDLRERLTVEAPTCHAARFDPATGRHVLLLEDLSARGCTFVDVLTPLTPDQAAAGLETLAQVHAPYWGKAPTWVPTNGGDPNLPLISLALRPLAKRLPPELLPPQGRDILRRYRQVARDLDRGPHTLLHGDPHPGNLYLVDGRVGLLDWQVLRRGNALRDVTYFLVLGLDTATRQSHQDQLLQHYLDALAGHGGPRLQPERAWSDVRRMTAYVYTATAFTAGLGGLQNDGIATAGLRQATAALLEFAS
jgi:hypothetical protein